MLMQIVPAGASDVWAVFAQPDGKPKFALVVTWGVFEFPPVTDGQAGKRLVSGIALGDHAEPADFKPEFVCYTDHPDAADFLDRCSAKLAEIALAEQKAKEAKIYVPPRDERLNPDWRRV